MSKAVELKPCPNCGGEAEVTSLFGWFPRCMTPGCINELGSGGGYGSKDEAIAAWNTRASEQAAYERGKAEERARIRAALEAEEKSNFQLADVAHEHGNLRQELVYSAARSALKKAINIVNQE